MTTTEATTEPTDNHNDVKAQQKETPQQPRGGSTVNHDTNDGDGDSIPTTTVNR